MIELNTAIFDKTATATILILVGAIIGEYAHKVTKRLLQKAKIINKLKIFGMRKPVRTLSALSRFAVYIVVLLALIKLDIVEFFIDVIIILILIFIVFGILFVTKDTIMNIYYSSKIKQKLKPGQHIEVARLTGVINSVSLGEVKITTKDNNLAIINKEFLAKNKFKLMRK